MAWHTQGTEFVRISSIAPGEDAPPTPPPQTAVQVIDCRRLAVLLFTCHSSHLVLPTFQEPHR